MTVITIRTRDGAQTIRADTARDLGIQPGECIGQRLWLMALHEDHQRAKLDRAA